MMKILINAERINDDVVAYKVILPDHLDEEDDRIKAFKNNLITFIDDNSDILEL